MDIKEILLSHKDSKYSEFSSGLIPGENAIIGVRLPILRKIAKEIANGDYKDYLMNSCNDMCYFEEIMLKGMVIGCLKVEDEEYWKLVYDFVPLINNWSVNDSFCAGLKRTSKQLDFVWDFLQRYLNSDKEFELRFGIVMLMDYFLVDEYAHKAIEVVASKSHKEYYARMAIAWFMATAYAKFPHYTMNAMNNRKFDDWTYNKSIQKMLESNRIGAEEKSVLRNMKIK